MLSERTFNDIASLMYETVGLSFSASKMPLISSRLAGRIRALGLSNYEDYYALIADAGNGGEFQMALDLLTTNETYFFREPEHYKLLAEHFSRERHDRVSVWSAASSFGDEAYSVAMLLADLQAGGLIGSDWSILGTDVSDRVLRTAKEGIYPEERLRAVSPERLKRYCLRGEENSAGFVQIKPSLRARVRWGWLNLCRPIEDLGPFDVIFLRNVLIYFDAPTKSAVVDRVLGQLRSGGLFFIGTAEGRVPCETPLETLLPGAFRKIAG